MLVTKVSFHVVIDMHDDVKCLCGLDLSNYEFVSCSNNGFIPAVIKLFDN
jgi:hypothetical protein